MGAIDRNGYRFETEFSVIKKEGAIHVYHNGEFHDEITFDFEGEFPDLDQIEDLVNTYCIDHNI
jgi:hypothetical protein